MTRFSPLALMAIALVCGWPATASAQPEPLQRPFRGLFGTVSDPNQQQSLVLSVSGFGSYDDDVLADAQGSSPTPGAQQGGYFAGASGSLGYAYSGDRFSMASDLSTSTRYQPDSRDLSALTLSGGVSLQKALGSRTSVEFASRGFKAPRYQLALLALEGEEFMHIDAYGGAYAIDRRDGVGVSSSAAIGHRLTTRTSLGASYGFSFSEYSTVGAENSRHRAGASIGHRFTSYSTLRLGYQYQTYGMDLTGQPIESHNFTAGIDFSRPWSLSGRRTQLTVHPGWSLVSDGERTQLRATGSVLLNHQLGRSWTAMAQYSRGVRFVDGLNLYTFSDQVGGGINGLLGRRLDLVLGAGYSTGQYGRLTDAGFNTYTGSAQMRYALTRVLAVFGQYFYYVYDFDRAGPVPVWFTPRMERQGVRIGLTAQVPLIR